MESKISDLFNSMYYVDDENKISKFILNRVLFSMKNIHFHSYTENDKPSAFLSHILFFYETGNKPSVDFSAELATSMKTISIQLQKEMKQKFGISKNTEDTEGQFREWKKDTLLSLTKNDDSLLWDFQNSNSQIPEDIDQLHRDYLEIFQEYQSLFDLVLKGIESNPAYFKEFLDLKFEDYSKSKIEYILFPIFYGSELNRETGFLTSDGKYDLSKISEILLVLGETLYAYHFVTGYQVGFANLEKYQPKGVIEMI